MPGLAPGIFDGKVLQSNLKSIKLEKWGYHYAMVL
jgi:hypothetical protein